jgi:DNA invertase Pin-like site-specific DNA recombinase
MPASRRRRWIVPASRARSTCSARATRTRCSSSSSIASRSVRDLGQLVEKFFASGKTALLSVSEQVDTRTASGRMVLNIMATISQWERECIGERTAAAMQHKAAVGEYIGGDPPFGWRVGADGRRLEPVTHEQMVIAEARRLRGEGLSLRAIARELDVRGHRSRVGRRFSSVQIRRMTHARFMTAAGSTGRAPRRKINLSRSTEESTHG